MQKFQLIILLTVSWFAQAQTLLSSRTYHIDKPQRNGQLNAFANESSNEFYVVAGREKEITAYKYNRALFFSDSLSTENELRQAYPKFVGNTFDQSGNPVAYYADDSFDKFTALKFDFEKKQVDRSKLDLSFLSSDLLGTLQAKNHVCFLSSKSGLGDENRLVLNTIRDTIVGIATLDFTPYEILDHNGKIISVKELLREYPIEFIDNRFFVPLAVASAKTKAYIDEKNLIITFDHRSEETQVFSIDVTSGVVTHEIIPHQNLTAEAAQSNSFYYNRRLFQFKLNEDELVLQSASLQDKSNVTTYSATSKSTLQFINSALSMQVGNKPVREFKNTEKFLKKASKATAALTVYKTPDHLLVTAGAVRNIASSEDVALSVLSIGLGAAVGSVDVPEMGKSNIQSFYFESLFDDSFIHQPVTQTPLAIDLITQFMTENRKSITLDSVIWYQGNYILSYYDKNKQFFELRKFEDYRRY